MNILAQLNPEQAQAVTTTEGPVLVLAGAGTGKTRVITYRMAQLLTQGVPASAILAMTFTNKAAKEMRERVKAIVGKALAKELTIGTYHAFCARVLREHGEVVGLAERFGIADSSDQIGIVKAVLRDLKQAETFKPSAILGRISLNKSKLLDADQALAASTDPLEELAARVQARYDEQLTRSRLIDFDDMLLYTLRLLRDHAEVREAFRERYRYLLVDEYQDTNGPQYEILRALAGGHRNLCVVGDDDQSIYGWRGADVSKILGFAQDFPGAKVVKLELNYRSTAHILDAANKVIACNLNRHPKTLRSGLGEGEHPVIHKLDDEMVEAEFIVREIIRRVQTAPVKLGDIAVLFRTGQQPRPLETALRGAQVPYVLVGGNSFFDRKEVRDVMSYVRLLANPDDEQSWLRIVNRPPRGVGKGSIDKALAVAGERGLSVPAAFEAAAADGTLSKTAAQGVGELRELVARFGVSEPGRDLVQRIGSLLEELCYRVEVDRCYPDKQVADDRWQGVLEVLDMAENYVSRAAKPTLPGFLERIALTANDDTTPEDGARREAVTLMTLHAAKGLEYDEVYLAGVEEGLIPHARSVVEDTVDEERRLMYVGITRAKRRLVITFAASRSRFGTRLASMPSRFLFEMSGQELPEGWQPYTPGGQKAQKKGRGRKKAARRR